MTLLRAEFAKLRTTPGPWIVLGVVAGLTGLGVLGAFLTPTRPPHLVVPTTVPKLRDLVGAGMVAAPILAPVIGILAVSGEYRYRTISATLLATPGRARLLVAKGAATALWALLLGVVSVVIVAAIGLPLFEAHHGSFANLRPQILPVVPGTLAAFALLSLFGIGVGVMVRNQIAGVLLTVGGALFGNLLLTKLFTDLLHIPANWLPSYAADSLAGGATATVHTLPWETGAAVLLAWGIVPGVIGYWTTFRRDIT